MKKYLPFIFPLLISILLQFSTTTGNVLSYTTEEHNRARETQSEPEHWLYLKRRSNIEILYHGIPGNQQQSKVIKVFKVKSGIPQKRPTPLPELLGQRYWLITDKVKARADKEIGPYFLKLDIPHSEYPPYGPYPYEECSGQCNWELPGAFGLHGVSNDNSKLSEENEGSSGCVRHDDRDIAYLYYLLNPNDRPVRYYIVDI